jgi:hypothetical protein
MSVYDKWTEYTGGSGPGLFNVLQKKHASEDW